MTAGVVKDFDLLHRVSQGDAQHTTCIVKIRAEALLLGVIAPLTRSLAGPIPVYLYFYLAIFKNCSDFCRADQLHHIIITKSHRVTIYIQNASSHATTTCYTRQTPINSESKPPHSPVTTLSGRYEENKEQTTDYCASWPI